jgi:hypothetical protein
VQEGAEDVQIVSHRIEFLGPYVAQPEGVHGSALAGREPVQEAYHVAGEQVHRAQTRRHGYTAVVWMNEPTLAQLGPIQIYPLQRGKRGEQLCDLVGRPEITASDL